jgi:hypothetical protein
MFDDGKNSLDIQIIETVDNNISLEEKIKSHIAFIYDEPLKEIKKIEKWAKNNNIKFIK